MAHYLKPSNEPLSPAALQALRIDSQLKIQKLMDEIDTIRNRLMVEENLAAAAGSRMLLG